MVVGEAAAWPWPRGPVGTEHRQGLLDLQSPTQGQGRGPGSSVGGPE